MIKAREPDLNVGSFFILMILTAVREVSIGAKYF